MANHYSGILTNGLWHNNQALVALLGLCPLLAVSNTVTNSLGLGIATTITLVLSNGFISACRQHILPEIRLPLFVLIIAGIVTMIELIMHAWFYELYQSLGIFIPLIVTNCAIIGRAEVFASKNPVLPSLLDGLAMGLGFSAALVLLGACREILSSGTLFAQTELLFGAMANHWQLTILDDYSGMLLAALPAGAFITLGLLIALKNALELKKQTQAITTFGSITEQHK
ncbi:MAG: RnfABCDGE type electron transport complex subunit E [Methyloprofundus sp.]|nr:RnfABCDGE type electron transport complex subunit E [Methyloprofundus sp.]